MKRVSSTDRRRLQRPLKGPTSRRPTGSPKRWRLALIAIGAVVAAALTAACGDSQVAAPGTPTPIASPTATPSPEQQLLEQMVLQAEYLPAGLQRIAAITTTNEDLAADAADPEEELSRLEASGRLLGYQVDFVPEALPQQGIVAVSSSARLYVTPEGASGSFADDAQRARSGDWEVGYPDLADLNVREVERPELADEIAWIRITGLKDGENDSLVLVIDDFLVLRRDRVRGFLRVESRDEASAGPDALLEEVAALVARQVERIDAALLGS